MPELYKTGIVEGLVALKYTVDRVVGICREEIRHKRLDKTVFCQFLF